MSQDTDSMFGPQWDSLAIRTSDFELLRRVRVHTNPTVPTPHASVLKLAVSLWTLFCLLVNFLHPIFALPTVLPDRRSRQNKSLVNFAINC
jgi:hypothetical protein